MNGKTAKAPAKSTRHRARELALQGIYQWRLSGNDAVQIEKQIAEEKGLGRFDAGFYSQLLRGVLAQPAELLAAISPHLDRPLDELSPIEYSVLLLAAYELLHLPEIPYRVVINEAVELAKSYGGTDGYKYVNGVLDKLAARARAVEMAAK
ncbi:MAG: transcription antitermination factor NusB [Gallionellaceae bacterium]